MAVNTYIVDKFNKNTATVVNHEEANALVVATRPLKTFINRTIFASNDQFGINMNVDASLSEESIILYDGDGPKWTPTAISGIWNFDSTTQVYIGTTSISAQNTSNGATMQLYNPEGLYTVTQKYLSGAIYITRWQTEPKAVEIYGYNTTTGQVVGNVIDISDYVITSNLNTWQIFNIETIDLNIYGREIDSIRIRTTSGGGVIQQYYLDYIRFLDDSGSGPLEYVIKPDFGKWLYVSKFGITIASEFDSTIPGSSIPNIPYDNLLGNYLPYGISYQRRYENKIIVSLNIKTILDILQLPGAKISNIGYDGTVTWIKIDLELHEPHLLKCTNNDRLSFTLFDNMTEFKVFKIMVEAKEEDRFVNYRE